MARTAITITSVLPFMAGTNLTRTAGDAANDHSVDMTASPYLHLLATNKNAATVAFTIELPASASTFSQAVSISHTIPAAAASVEGKRLIVLDAASVRQSDGTLYIDSADANFADASFYAYTWTPTRVA